MKKQIFGSLMLAFIAVWLLINFSIGENIEDITYYTSFDELPSQIKELTGKSILENEPKPIFVSAYSCNYSKNYKEYFVVTENYNNEKDIGIYFIKNGEYGYVDSSKLLPHFALKANTTLSYTDDKGDTIDYNFKKFKFGSYSLNNIYFHKENILVEIQPWLNRVAITDKNTGNTNYYAGNYFMMFSNFEFNIENYIPKKPYDILNMNNISGYKYAVVNNPKPQDRLNLRTKPNANSAYKGKYYNGTVVKVLSNYGDWVKVSIGDGELQTGYMLKKYLSFNVNPIKVKAAFPKLRLDFGNNSKIDMYKYFYLSNTSTIEDKTQLYATNANYYQNCYILGLIGPENDKYYHVAFKNGEIGFVSAKWFVEE